MKVLLSGNEAIARGAWQAGTAVATGYPGTPSTEILEALSAFKDDLYLEWSPNEKVAFEVAAGASLTGARAIVTMKHVGLNVAADPLMTLSYIGIEGGFVACVADDPGMHSSQTEQDTRHYARLAKVPVFEPADSGEALALMAHAMEISERFRTPAILRSTTRVSHSRSLVEVGPRRAPNPVAFVPDPPRHVPIPLWGRKMRRDVEERLGLLARAAETSPANRIEWRDRSRGFIAVGIAYQYVREVFPDASVLKLSWCYPFPDRLFFEFAQGVHDIIVVEELEPIVEEHVKALGIRCRGKEFVPTVGELDPDRLREVKEKLAGRAAAPIKALPPEAADLPGRPPVLCPGCPHRGVFHALTKRDVIVTGDIGCYSLGVFPPLNRTDVILCMGGGVSMAQGMDKAGEQKPVVGIVGDSTFFHSGITGLLDIAYNRGKSTIIVVDNRTTAMTGHQEHPGTGRTLMGERTGEASIEEFGIACGIDRVAIVDPYDLKACTKTILAELDADEPSLVISRAPCPLKTGKKLGAPRRVDPDVCVLCGKCGKLGCPAIEVSPERVRINELLCIGCSMCDQVCGPGAIVFDEEEN